MNKQLIRVTAIAAGLVLVVTASAFAKREVIQAGNIFLADNGGISPSKLPRHAQTPISAHIDGEIGTIDGGHVPAVETVTVDFDRTIQVHARGLPDCRLGQLTARSTAAARRVCAQAIVGTGQGDVEVAFPEQRPFSAKGPITLFNGGVRGGTTLLFIHAYVPVPAPTAVIATVKITHINRGHFGLHTVTQIPKIAGGAGSVTKFRFRIDRRFVYRGKRESYLTASCPTGHYFTEGHVLFSDGTGLGLTHILPCTPKG